MPAPNEQDYVKVSEGGVTVKVADPDGVDPDIPAAYSEAMCLRGAFTINDNKEQSEEDVANWCAAQTANTLRTATHGDRTVDMELEVELLPGSTIEQTIIDAYENETDLFLQVIASDTNATPNTRTWEYEGRVFGSSPTFNEEGTSTIRFPYRAHRVMPSGGWPV